MMGNTNNFWGPLKLNLPRAPNVLRPALLNHVRACGTIPLQYVCPLTGQAKFLAQIIKIFNIVHVLVGGCNTHTYFRNVVCKICRKIVDS